MLLVARCDRHPHASPLAPRCLRTDRLLLAGPAARAVIAALAAAAAGPVAGVGFGRVVARESRKRERSAAKENRGQRRESQFELHGVPSLSVRRWARPS